ncbi:MULTISPECIES: DUF3082 domain-containing protein [Spirulina sp. CCY15215]|uniref:DUF3082 domain-containing protein n=1 Tax=Spirulina sp. CCY15215 TaxID=2767591 RepID=UPI00194F1C4F|nr:DUF3082 domain-containing protein [Spirulina major]
MSDSSPTSDRKPVTPLQCLIGSSIAAGFATLLYLLTTSITGTLAHTPLPSTTAASLRIAIAVRTLVAGLATLATAVFAIAAIGLIALGIQIALSKKEQNNCL